MHAMQWHPYVPTKLQAGSCRELGCRPDAQQRGGNLATSCSTDCAPLLVALLLLRRGWLDAEQLRMLLTGCQDGLTADEANAMIDAAADNQGRLNYQEYALRLATDGREV